MKTSIQFFIFIVFYLCFFTKAYGFHLQYDEHNTSNNDSLVNLLKTADKETTRSVLKNLTPRSENIVLKETAAKLAIQLEQKEAQLNNTIFGIFSLGFLGLLLILYFYTLKKQKTKNKVSSKIKAPSPDLSTNNTPTPLPPSSLIDTSKYLDKQTNNYASLIQQIKVLKEENETWQRQLTANSLEFIRHENLVKTIGQKLPPVIKNVQGDIRNQLIELNNLLERHRNHKDEWENFKFYFEQINPSFIHILQESFPNLNNNDIRLIAFIRLSLNTGEIATLLRVSSSSIHKARYRLKKKLSLEKEIDLDRYLLNL